MKLNSYSDIQVDIKSIYILDLGTAKHFKVGESHTGTFSRGADNVYWTGQGNNGTFTVFYTEENVNNEDMRKYEKKLLNYCCEKVSNGSAGCEVFCFENDWKNKSNMLIDVKEYISKEMPIFNKYFESTVEDIRKQICKKPTFIPNNYEILYNSKGVCYDCNKKLSKKIYRVTIEGDERYILVDFGESCFKKIRLNENAKRSKHFKEIENHFQKIIKRSKINSSRIEEEFEDEDESICNSDDDDSIISVEYSTEDDEIFDLFYHNYLIDGRSVKKYILQLKYKISEYKPEKIKTNIIWATLYLFFVKEGKFDLNLDFIVKELQNLLYEEEDYKHNLNNEFISYILTFYTLFKVKNNTVVFYKKELTTKYIINKLGTIIDKCCSIDLPNNIDKYSEKMIFKTHKTYEYTDQQKEALDGKKVVTGVAGAGKSTIIEQKILIAGTVKKSKTICITPTHSSKDNLVHKIQKNIRDKIDFKVISSLNIKIINYQINTKFQNIETINIIIDEFSMLDINGWYRIIHLIKICLENGKKVCILITGDIYQIKPISFEKETSEIASYLYYISYNLEKCMRSGNTELESIIKHKCGYSKNILTQITDTYDDEYNESDFINFIEDNYESFDKIITSTNNLRVKINSTIYKKEHVKKCIDCTRNIFIDECKFCKKCLHKYEFRNENNIKFYKYKLDFDVEENSYYLKIGNMKTKLKKDMYDRLVKEKEGIFETDIGYFIIKDKSESFIFIDKEEKTYILRKRSCKHDSLFYNGEKIYITQEEDDIYKISNTNLDIDSDDCVKTHYITRDYFYKNMEKNVCLTYAETVNKSQGRTYKRVLFVLGDTSKISSDKIYVASTRHIDKLEYFFISNKNFKILPSDIIPYIPYRDLEFKENSEIMCYCDVKAYSSVSQKENKNKGKKFYNCGNKRRDNNGTWIGCGFFVW